MIFLSRSKYINDLISNRKWYFDIVNNLKLVFSNLKAVGVVKEEEEERDTPWYPEDPMPEDDDIARE